MKRSTGTSAAVVAAEASPCPFLIAVSCFSAWYFAALPGPSVFFARAGGGGGGGGQQRDGAVGIWNEARVSPPALAAEAETSSGERISTSSASTTMVAAATTAAFGGGALRGGGRKGQGREGGGGAA